MRIYLVGYMGSGKSKTAEALAKLFKYEVADIDRIIELNYNTTISAIFKKDGEDYFRELEKNVLRQTAKKTNLIVSTGGGTTSYSDNMDWMNENGISVYLEANPGLLFHRLASSRKGRPLIEHLDDVELMEQITGHLAVRIADYKKSVITVNAFDINVKSLADKIQSFKKK